MVKNTRLLTVEVNVFFNSNMTAGLSFNIIFSLCNINTVYREFFASGKFGENDAWKVC